MLMGLSIGTRNGVAKDSLQNIRERGGFCVNVVTESQLHAMNVTAGEFPPDVDEFIRAGLSSADAETVDAPFVADCPAVFECRLFKEIDLAPHVSLIVGEALAIRLGDGVEVVDGTRMIDTGSLKPVGRLSGAEYGMLGERLTIERPQGS